MALPHRSSISGIVKQSQLHYAYNASKAAANHLTETIAYEVTNATTARVRVNAILPGVFPSQMTAEEKDDKTNKSDLSDKLPEMNVPVGESVDLRLCVQERELTRFRSQVVREERERWPALASSSLPTSTLTP